MMMILSMIADFFQISLVLNTNTLDNVSHASPMSHTMSLTWVKSAPFWSRVSVWICSRYVPVFQKGLKKI